MCKVTDYYGDEHTMPGPFRDLDEITAANRRTGNHFFDRDTMRFFGSRLAPGVIGGRLIVTSEQDRSPYLAPEDRPWGGLRRYTVRLVADDGTVKSVGPVKDDPNDDSSFGAFDNLRQARKWAERYARGEVQSCIAKWAQQNV